MWVPRASEATSLDAVDDPSDARHSARQTVADVIGAAPSAPKRPETDVTSRSPGALGRREGMFQREYPRDFIQEHCDGTIEFPAVLAHLARAVRVA